MPSVGHDEVMSRVYAEDVPLAVDSLNDVLEDGEPGEALILLRQLAGSFGGVPRVAESAGLNPTQLYRMLSSEGNPTLSSLIAVLKVMKLKLQIAPLDSEVQQREVA